MNRQARYREKNREEISRKQKQWRAENKERVKELAKRGREKNRDKIIKYRKEYYAKNKEQALEFAKQYKSDNPWLITYESARARCRNRNSDSFKYYGAKGILFNMKPNDFKFLWFRDGADKMEQPSISRHNHLLDYTLDNCCYEEFKEHIKRDKK